MGKFRERARGCVAGGLLALSGAAMASNGAAQDLPGMTAAETAADHLWSLRAGLNVAALQCQFSPFLRTAGNYNALLRQHSDEFTRAFNTINKYFIRVKGPKAGPRAFDTYATRANQSFSTFDAQYAFCEAAADVGRKVLGVPKGKLTDVTDPELDVLRASLAQKVQFPKLRSYVWATVPDLSGPPCKKKKGC